MRLCNTLWWNVDGARLVSYPVETLVFITATYKNHQDLIDSSYCIIIEQYSDSIEISPRDCLNTVQETELGHLLLQRGAQLVRSPWNTLKTNLMWKIWSEFTYIQWRSTGFLPAPIVYLHTSRLYITILLFSLLKSVTYRHYWIRVCLIFKTMCTSYMNM